MTVFEDIEAWRRERQRLPDGHTLGVVPTMGALHEGHRALIGRSTAENTRTLVTVFVNPAQFDDPADLAAYPRTWDADRALLEAAGVDYVLIPPAEQVYRDGYRYRVIARQAAATLEGAHRPGHFDGVLTVVLKLLLLAGARRAYFGEKDWEQLELVRGMADAFFLPTTIVPCPTVRESSGLALSSRNGRLTPPQRDLAPLLYRTISTAASAAEARAALEGAGFAVDYVTDRDTRRLAAVRLGSVRLIDNVPLRSPR